MRMPDLTCKIVSKLFYQNQPIFTPKSNHTSDRDYVLRNFMRRVLMFDLAYLLELK